MLLKYQVTEGNLLVMATSCKGPQVSHLLFAYDSLIFCRATSEEDKKLKNTLQVYEAIFGQHVNFFKSGLFFSPNDIGEQRSQFMSIFRVAECHKVAKYLGLLACMGCNKKRALGFLKECLCKQISGWWLKML